MWGKAADGQYTSDFGAVRDRAAAAGTAAVVSEFGHPLGGTVSDRAPTVVKAMHQALDSRVPGANWWSKPASSGPVLSGTQWQWDIYSGRHHALMNGNPGKVLTSGDAWNDEDLSAVRLDDTGTVTPRQDVRLLDRLCPSATSGATAAFTYEDRSRDGSTTLPWNPVPGSLPNVAQLVGSGRLRAAGVALGQRLGADRAAPAGVPPHVRHHRGLRPGTVHAPPGYTTSAPVAVAAEPGGTGSRRLLLTDSDAGVLHYALVTDGACAPSAALLGAARSELSAWAAAHF